MKNCPKCRNKIELKSNYCSSCGHSFNLDYDEFEMGKIYALNSIKSDFLKWIGGISIILTVLGFFGINELIDSKVTEVVEQKLNLELNRLKSDIDANKASLTNSTIELYKTLAQTKINSEELQMLINKNKVKSHTLENSAKELEMILQSSFSESNQLRQIINENESKTKQLEESLVSTIKTKEALDNVLFSENTLTIFSKLQYDFFTIKSFKVKIVVRVSNLYKDSLYLHLLNPRVDIENPSDTTNWSGLELSYLDNSATSISDEYYTDYNLKMELFRPFEEKYIGSQMDLLNGIKEIKISFREPINPNEFEGEQEFESYKSMVIDFVNTQISYIHEIRAEISLNDYPMWTYLIPNSELVLDSTTELFEPFQGDSEIMTYSRSINTGEDFSNVRDKYKNKIEILLPDFN